MLSVSGCGKSACWCGDGVCVVGNVTMVVALWCMYVVWTAVLWRWCCVHGWGSSGV